MQSQRTEDNEEENNSNECEQCDGWLKEEYTHYIEKIDRYVCDACMREMLIFSSMSKRILGVMEYARDNIGEFEGRNHDAFQRFKSELTELIDKFYWYDRLR